MAETFEYRVRRGLPREWVRDNLEGRLLTENSRVNLIQGQCSYFAPDGRRLCVYLPGAIKEEMDEAYEILTTIRATTENRGMASATAQRVKQHNQMRGIPVTSTIVGAFEASGFYSKQCRLTSWTNKQLADKWPALFPLFQSCSKLFEAHAPERFAAQMQYVERTEPDWIIEGTPFTTCTINNSYPTGVHLDDGDLDEGFSVLAVARKGEYTGGVLNLPEFGLGVDLQHGDVLLMNAHAYHGNTPLFCACGKQWGKSIGHAGTKPCPDCGAERISVVLYYRTNMTSCGTKSEEDAKGVAWSEKISAGPVGG